MSIALKIKSKIQDIAYFNKIRLENIEVKEKIATDEIRYKKNTVYEVKIFLKEQNVYLDYFFVFYYPFIIRFKVYRCIIQLDKRILKFTLKERNLSVLKGFL